MIALNAALPPESKGKQEVNLHGTGGNSNHDIGNVHAGYRFDGDLRPFCEGLRKNLGNEVNNDLPDDSCCDPAIRLSCGSPGQTGKILTSTRAGLPRDTQLKG